MTVGKGFEFLQLTTNNTSLYVYKHHCIVQNQTQVEEYSCVAIHPNLSH